MNFTPTQKTTFKAAILAEPAVAAFLAAGNDTAIADYYNQASSPAFTVWRSSLSRAEVYDAITWTELIGRSAGERDTLQIMLVDGQLNPASANIRQGITDIFSGASGVNSRTNLAAASKRTATNLEKLFATGTGTIVAPALMALEGSLTNSDIAFVLRG